MSHVSSIPLVPDPASVGPVRCRKSTAMRVVAAMTRAVHGAPGTCGFGRPVDSVRCASASSSSAWSAPPSWRAGRSRPGWCCSPIGRAARSTSLVGLTMTVPIAIAVAGFVWPPVTRGSGAFAGDGLAGDRRAAVPDPVDRRRRRAAPGVRLADAPAVARGGLSVAPGPGRDQPLQRPRDRPAACGARPRCAAGGSSTGLSIAVALTLLSGIALRRRGGRQRARRARHGRPTSSRFGPTDPDGEPPLCDGAARGRAATPGCRPGCRRRSTCVRSARSSFAGRATAATSAGPRTSPPTDELGQAGAARIGGDAWSQEPGGGWRPGRARRGRGRDRRPPGARDGLDHRQPGDRRGPRRGGHRGRPGAALSRRRGRRDVRGGLPADPLARRRRGPPSLARPARLLGLPRRPARPGGRRAGGDAAGLGPDAITGDVSVAPDRHGTRPRRRHLSSALDDRRGRAGPLRRQARPAGPADPAAWPSCRPTPTGIRTNDIAERVGMSVRTVYRDLSAIDEEIGVPVWAEGGLLGGRVGQGVPAAAQAHPVRGDGRRPVGPADGPLRRQVRPRPRRGLREAGGGLPAAAGRARRADARRPVDGAARRAPSASTSGC